MGIDLEDVIEMTESEYIPKPEELAPIKHKCICPDENFMFNGVYCQCGGA